VVSWKCEYKERTEYNYTWANGVSASFNLNGGADDWTGDFDFDWRPAGKQSKTVASGSTWVPHNSDGSKTVSLEFSIGSTGTSGGGGPATVTLSLGLTKLTVVPAVPSGVTAVRVSDTQTKVSWSRGTSASNGQPTTQTIQQSINGGAWTTLVTVNNTTTATVATSANRKVQYRVRQNNAAGSSSYSAASSAIYTTPTAPSNVTATKGADLNITVAFTENVGYNEYQHEVWHGVVVSGVTTWDGSAMVTLASGVTSYVHVNPNASQVHIYRVRAKTSSGTALYSGYVSSNSVQLLVAPNAPTLASMPAIADKTVALTYTWTHNPVDTTPQSAYEFSYSTNGGTTWSTSGKVVTTSRTRTIAANTYPANTQLTVRVRTWGAATTGGADGTGASAWSTNAVTTFKTAPVASITSPANGAVINDSKLFVTLGFAQAEAATFSTGTIQLYDAATNELLEEMPTNSLASTRMGTQVQDDSAYTLKARVRDSNGLWSAWVTSGFSVSYLSPALPTDTLTYLPDTGWMQIDLTFPDPGPGEAPATYATILRSVDGGPWETVMDSYPVASPMTVMDTTPSIHGVNTYQIIAITDLGAQGTVYDENETTECKNAFLSKGDAFDNVVVFGGNLKVDESLDVASTTVEMAGRTKPIGLYSNETSVSLKVSSRMFDGFGTGRNDMRNFLLTPGKACYRDATGRRVFGTLTGSLSWEKSDRGDLDFTLTETS
jgi:hypothetical protein